VIGSLSRFSLLLTTELMPASAVTLIARKRARPWLRIMGVQRLTRIAILIFISTFALCFGTVRAASINDVFAGIAMRVPEFAGVHIDEHQDILYVHMRNGNSATVRAAVAELKAAFGDQHLKQGRVEMLPATFRFSELKHWHDRIAIDVLQHPGVTFIGIDHADNRVVVGVEDSDVRSSLEPKLVGYRLPPEAIHFMETGPAEFKSDLRGFNRPLVGGLEIETPFSSCSLGFIAKRAGVLGFVTASHCSNPDMTPPGREGTPYFQPSGGSQVGRSQRPGLPRLFMCPSRVDIWVSSLPL
jgi:hypothetical protein